MNRRQAKKNRKGREPAISNMNWSTKIDRDWTIMMTKEPKKRYRNIVSSHKRAVRGRRKLWNEKAMKGEVIYESR